VIEPDNSAWYPLKQTIRNIEQKMKRNGRKFQDDFSNTQHLILELTGQSSAVTETSPSLPVEPESRIDVLTDLDTSISSHVDVSEFVAPQLKHTVLFHQKQKCQCASFVQSKNDAGHKTCHNHPSCQPFILILQMEWQRQFLADDPVRGHIAFIDFTHKVNDLNWPLGIIALQNSDGSGVPFAYMICSAETESTISKFVEVVGQCSPNFKPQIFMMDKSVASISAIHRLNPRIEIRLCYWHVREAWRRKLVECRLLEPERQGIMKVSLIS